MNKIKELATECGVSTEAIRKWCSKNGVAKAGKHWNLTEVDVRAVREYYLGAATNEEPTTKLTNEAWLENLDIGDALELFDALIYHIDGRFEELNLTYLAEDTWKKLLNEYHNYGRRVYEEYASEIRRKDWSKIREWSAISGYEITTFDPAGPHTTFSPQSILEEHQKGRDA